MMQALKTPLTTAWPDLTWSTLTGGKHCARLPCSNHKLQELWTVWLRLSRDWNQAYKANKLIQESLTSITTTQNQLLLSCCLHGQHCPKFTCAVLGMLLIPANYNLRQAFWQVGNTPKSHTQWLHKMGFKKCVHNWCLISKLNVKSKVVWIHFMCQFTELQQMLKSSSNTDRTWLFLWSRKYVPMHTHNVDAKTTTILLEF